MKISILLAIVFVFLIAQASLCLGSMSSTNFQITKLDTSSMSGAVDSSSSNFNIDDIKGQNVDKYVANDFKSYLGFFNPTNITEIKGDFPAGGISGNVTEELPTGECFIFGIPCWLFLLLILILIILIITRRKKKKKKPKPKKKPKKEEEEREGLDYDDYETKREGIN